MFSVFHRLSADLSKKERDLFFFSFSVCTSKQPHTSFVLTILYQLANHSKKNLISLSSPMLRFSLVAPNEVLMEIAKINLVQLIDGAARHPINLIVCNCALFTFRLIIVVIATIESLKRRCDTRIAHLLLISHLIWLRHVLNFEFKSQQHNTTQHTIMENTFFWISTKYLKFVNERKEKFFFFFNLVVHETKSHETLNELVRRHKECTPQRSTRLMARQYWTVSYMYELSDVFHACVSQFERARARETVRARKFCTTWTQCMRKDVSDLLWRRWIARKSPLRPQLIVLCSKCNRNSLWIFSLSVKPRERGCQVKTRQSFDASRYRNRSGIIVNIYNTILCPVNDVITTTAFFCLICCLPINFLATMFSLICHY